MTFFKTLILATALSIVSTAAEDECPAGWRLSIYNGNKCCPGSMLIDKEGPYCCVYDTRPFKEALADAAKLYATATTTDGTDWSTFRNTCLVEIRLTATDYSAQVSSAASRAEATPIDSSTSEVTSTSKGASTSRATSERQVSSPSQVTSTATTDSLASSGTGSQTSSPPATSNPAIPLATGQGVLGGAALAAALFML
ncbi:hypothetical protein N7517_003917 [Penicillium concentricum]|uniref:Extracellular membrane protein CFEM domain-containing protein n=1 Tax=Penicillium concentricum TaxID=293559 RepID=A0A9W9S4K7_9EURO|nr:uncharacterized protein N7517_003917 [Penicillium concentricum]KAJ5371911.1 hypothetical protein N7517_003917 [Penicillium concentricum]